MDEMEELRRRAADLVEQLLSMFPPEDAAYLIRVMADGVEQGQDIVRQVSDFIGD